jgi:thioredoxin reductase (NADPH)
MEAIGRDLREMQRMPLEPAHVDALRQAGTVVDYAEGDYLARPGEPIDRFSYIEHGEIEVVNAYTGERLTPAGLDPTQFMAEIPLLSGGNWAMPMRAAKPTRVVEVPRVEILPLMSNIPEMSDIILTVLAARRRRHVELRESSLILVGQDVDRDVRRVAEFVVRNKIPHTVLPSGSAEAQAASPGLRYRPGGGCCLLRP